MNSKIITTICLILFSSFAYCQSVESLIQKAKEYNPGLKSLRLEYKAAQQKADQVNDWPDPKVNLGIGVLPVETRLGAQRFKLGVSQMIPWKGSLDAKSNVAKSMAEVKSNLDKVKEIDIEYAIRIEYTKIAFIENKKDILYKKIEILDALEELAKSAVRSGKGKLSNVLFTVRKREQLLTDLELLNKKIEQPTIRLNRWTGNPLNTKIDISNNSTLLLDKENLISFAESEHPLYQVLNNKVSASKAKIKLTEFDIKPKIGVGLDYAYVSSRSDVVIPGNGRDILMPMGSISIPIHTGRFEAVKQEETIKQEAIDAQRQEIKDMYFAELEMAYSMIEYSDQIEQKFISLKKITKETLELMRAEYASEGTRFEELLRLEMELIDYDLEILNADFEKKTAIATLYKFK